MRMRTSIVILLLASACSSATVTDPVAGGATPSPSAVAGGVRGGVAASAAPSGGGSVSGVQPSSAVPGDSSAPARTQAPPVGNDDGGVGANALAYLRDAHRRLAIEVDAASGRQPNSATLDHVRSELGRAVSKPDGISVTTSTFDPPGSVYSLDDILSLERRLRGTSTSGSTASMYVLFLNGRYEDDSVLGLAYSASAFVIFKDAIAASSSLVVSAAAIERSVTLHEIGHLLRLVNIGYTSPRDHEDPDHANHSRNRDSVMYWAVESDVISTLFNGPPPDRFAADDLADLADLKAGRL